MTKKQITRFIPLAIVAVIIGFLVWYRPIKQNGPEYTIEPTVTSNSTLKPVTSKKTPGQYILLDVPFTRQAPFGNWDDERQQDGCEEASALMAVRWAKDQDLTLKEAENEILAASDFEFTQYGSYHDTSVADSITRIYVGYFHFNNAEAHYGISSADIISELSNGNLVVVPANGQKLNNPNFTYPGPTHHMLVIRGYDPKTNEFITNDPGTRLGEEYRYPVSTMMNAIYDYVTGDDEPVPKIIKAMIVVKHV